MLLLRPLSDVEFLFESGNEFDALNRLSAQILDEAVRVANLPGRRYRERLGDDLFDTVGDCL